MDIFALNSLLIASLSVFRLSSSFGILNLAQTVRTDLYAKMEMLSWICDIYRPFQRQQHKQTLLHFCGPNLTSGRHPNRINNNS